MDLVIGFACITIITLGVTCAYYAVRLESIYQRMRALENKLIKYENV